MQKRHRFARWEVQTCEKVHFNLLLLFQCMYVMWCRLLHSRYKYAKRKREKQCKTNIFSEMNESAMGNVDRKKIMQIELVKNVILFNKIVTAMQVWHSNCIFFIQTVQFVSGTSKYVWNEGKSYIYLLSYRAANDLATSFYFSCIKHICPESAVRYINVK